MDLALSAATCFPNIYFTPSPQQEGELLPLKGNMNAVRPL